MITMVAWLFRGARCFIIQPYIRSLHYPSTITTHIQSRDTENPESTKPSKWRKLKELHRHNDEECLRAHAHYFRAVEPEPEQENQNPNIVEEVAEIAEEHTPFFQSFTWGYSLWEKDRVKQTSLSMLYVVGEGPKPIILEEPLPSPKKTPEERRAEKMRELEIEAGEGCSRKEKRKVFEINEDWPKDLDEEDEGDRKMKRKV